MPLPPSHVPIVAELIRQGRPRPTQLFIALQLWLVATAASPRAFENRDTETTGACSIHVLKPFPGFPIGDKRAFFAPTVSAPNRLKRDNCCSARNPQIPAAAPPWWRLKIGCPVVYSKTAYYTDRRKEQPCPQSRETPTPSPFPCHRRWPNICGRWSRRRTAP